MLSAVEAIENKSLKGISTALNVTSELEKVSL